MPHEPLTGDALLDALSEVPGDPAEPVPATVPMRRRDYKLTPEDIAVVKDRQRREAEANPIFPPGGLTLRPPVPDPGQALDDAARRSVEWRKVTSLLSGLRDRHWNDDFSARPLSEPTPEQRQAERDAEFDRRHVHDASDPYTHHYLDVVLSIPSHKQTDPPPASEALIIDPTEEENPE